MKRVLRLGILRVARVARAAHPLVSCKGRASAGHPQKIRRPVATLGRRKPAGHPTRRPWSSIRRAVPSHCRCDAKGEILTFGFALVLLNLRLRPPPRSSLGEEGEKWLPRPGKMMRRGSWLIARMPRGNLPLPRCSIHGYALIWPFHGQTTSFRQISPWPACLQNDLIGDS